MIIKDCQLFHKSLPSQGKLLAIDVGTKRIGLAVSDELRILTTPKLIISRQGNIKDFTIIENFIKNEMVVAVIIGFPINMDGTLNEMSQFSHNFATEFDKFLSKDLPIFFADERLTSFAAKEVALSLKSRKKNKHHDDIAASIILRDFIDIYCK